MKKLYVVTGQTLVWAHDQHDARLALEAIDKYDMWIVGNDDVEEVFGEPDIPEGYGRELCAVDSDRVRDEDVWTSQSVQQLLEQMAYAKFPPKNSVEDKLVAMELQIQELTGLVNKLLRAKLYGDV